MLKKISLKHRTALRKIRKQLKVYRKNLAKAKADGNKNDMKVYKISIDKLFHERRIHNRRVDRFIHKTTRRIRRRAIRFAKKAAKKLRHVNKVKKFARRSIRKAIFNHSCRVAKHTVKVVHHTMEKRHPKSRKLQRVRKQINAVVKKAFKNGHERVNIYTKENKKNHRAIHLLTRAAKRAFRKRIQKKVKRATALVRSVTKHARRTFRKAHRMVRKYVTHLVHRQLSTLRRMVRRKIKMAKINKKAGEVMKGFKKAEFKTYHLKTPKGTRLNIKELPEKYKKARHAKYRAGKMYRLSRRYFKRLSRALGRARKLLSKVVSSRNYVFRIRRRMTRRYMTRRTSLKDMVLAFRTKVLGNVVGIIKQQTFHLERLALRRARVQNRLKTETKESEKKALAKRLKHMKDARFAARHMVAVAKAQRKVVRAIALTAKKQARLIKRAPQFTEKLAELQVGALKLVSRIRGIYRKTRRAKNAVLHKIRMVKYLRRARRGARLVRKAGLPRLRMVSRFVRSAARKVIRAVRRGIRATKKSAIMVARSAKKMGVKVNTKAEACACEPKKYFRM